MPPLLQLHDIRLVLDRTEVLRDLDFSVAAGEIHALLGANGSGKSSLAFMVMGCQGYAPASGRLTFDQRDIAGFAIHERARAGISLAWQEPTRFEGLSVRDYLQLAPGGPPAEDCLAAVGLDPGAYLMRMIDRSLSGGERKRIELAAMLAMRPRLAILDEPAAGVDVLAISAVTDAIRDLRRNGSSVLLITHQENIAACADRASQLCSGTVVFEGTPEAVASHYRTRSCLRCDGASCRHSHSRAGGTLP